jgi:hypothetical protein
VNTKLRELSQKATEYCIANGKPEPWVFEDKFAEAVVLECIRIINIWSNEEPCSEGYDTFLVHKLKDEFGLK